MLHCRLIQIYSVFQNYGITVHYFSKKQFHVFMAHSLSRLLLIMERVHSKIFNRGIFTTGIRLEYLEFQCQKWQFSIESLCNLAFWFLSVAPTDFSTVLDLIIFKQYFGCKKFVGGIERQVKNYLYLNYFWTTHSSFNI